MAYCKKFNCNSVEFIWVLVKFDQGLVCTICETLSIEHEESNHKFRVKFTWLLLLNDSHFSKSKKIVASILDLNLRTNLFLSVSKLTVTGYILNIFIFQFSYPISEFVWLFKFILSSFSIFLKTTPRRWKWPYLNFLRFFVCMLICSKYEKMFT